MDRLFNVVYTDIDNDILYTRYCCENISRASQLFLSEQREGETCLKIEEMCEDMWIDVSDKLPEYDGTYLVQLSKESEQYQQYIRFQDGKWVSNYTMKVMNLVPIKWYRYAAKCSLLGEDDNVVFKVDPYYTGNKTTFDGHVMSVDDKKKTVRVIYLEGYKERQDEIPFEDMIAVHDVYGEHMEFPGVSGKSALLKPE